MVTRTAALRLQLLDSVSGPARGVASSLSGIDKAIARGPQNHNGDREAVDVVLE